MNDDDGSNFIRLVIFVGVLLLGGLMIMALPDSAFSAPKAECHSIRSHADAVLGKDGNRVTKVWMMTRNKGRYRLRFVYFRKGRIGTGLVFAHRPDGQYRLTKRQVIPLPIIKAMMGEKAWGALYGKDI